MTELPRPVVVTLPFDMLVSENDRLTVSYRSKQIILTTAYRQALASARLAVLRQWQGPRWVHPVSVTARIFSKPGVKNDVQNFTKILCDALEPHAIANDRLISDWRIFRSGECDNARAEVELVPMKLSWSPGPTTFRDQWGRVIDPVSQSGNQWEPEE